MNLEFDPQKLPELSVFRKACLAERYQVMSDIAARAHHWYSNENPQGVPMEKLARTFQAQYYSSMGDVSQLQGLIQREPWVVNEPWTAQGWLPITQAASTHGDRAVIDVLLDAGADVSLIVGDPDDQASVPDMARAGGHADLAKFLQSLLSPDGASA